MAALRKAITTVRGSALSLGRCSPPVLSQLLLRRLSSQVIFADVQPSVPGGARQGRTVTMQPPESAEATALASAVLDGSLTVVEQGTAEACIASTLPLDDEVLLQRVIDKLSAGRMVVDVDVLRRQMFAAQRMGARRCCTALSDLVSRRASLSNSAKPASALVPSKTGTNGAGAVVAAGDTTLSDAGAPAESLERLSTANSKHGATPVQVLAAVRAEVAAILKVADVKAQQSLVAAMAALLLRPRVLAAITSANCDALAQSLTSLGHLTSHLTPSLHAFRDELRAGASQAGVVPTVAKAGSRKLTAAGGQQGAVAPKRPASTTSFASLLMQVAANTGQFGAASLAWDTVRSFAQPLEASAADAWLHLLVHNDKFNEALTIYERLLLAGLTPTSRTLATVLDACAGTDDLGRARGVWSALTLGAPPARPPVVPDLDAFVAFARIAARCGNVREVMHLFDRLRRHGIAPDARFFAQAILSCCHADQGQTALSLYDEMLTTGITPTEETFESLLIVAASHADVGMAREVMVALDASDVFPTESIYKALVYVAQRVGDVTLAYDWLQDYRASKLIGMPPTHSQPSSATPGDSAAFAAPVSPDSPSSAVSTETAAAAVSSDRVVVPTASASTSTSVGTPGDVFPYVAVLRAASLAQDTTSGTVVSTAEGVFAQIGEDGLVPTPQAYEMMIRIYAINGEVGKASALLDSIPTSIPRTTAMYLPIIRCSGIGMSSPAIAGPAIAALRERLAQMVSLGVPRTTEVYAAFTAAALDMVQPSLASEVPDWMQADSLAPTPLIYEHIICAAVAGNRLDVATKGVQDMSQFGLAATPKTLQALSAAARTERTPVRTSLSSAQADLTAVPEVALGGDLGRKVQRYSRLGRRGRSTATGTGADGASVDESTGESNQGEGESSELGIGREGGMVDPSRRVKSFIEKPHHGGFALFPSVTVGGAQAQKTITVGGIRVPIPLGMRAMSEAQARKASLAGISSSDSPEGEAGEEGEGAEGAGMRALQAEVRAPTSRVRVRGRGGVVLDACSEVEAMRFVASTHTHTSTPVTVRCGEGDPEAMVRAARADLGLLPPPGHGKKGGSAGARGTRMGMDAGSGSEGSGGEEQEYNDDDDDGMGGAMDADDGPLIHLAPVTDTRAKDYARRVAARAQGTFAGGADSHTQSPVSSSSAGVPGTLTSSSSSAPSTKASRRQGALFGDAGTSVSVPQPHRAAPLPTAQRSRPARSKAVTSTSATPVRDTPDAPATPTASVNSEKLSRPSLVSASTSTDYAAMTFRQLETITREQGIGIGRRVTGGTLAQRLSAYDRSGLASRAAEIESMTAKQLKEALQLLNNKRPVGGAAVGDGSGNSASGAAPDAPSESTPRSIHRLRAQYKLALIEQHLGDAGAATSSTLQQPTEGVAGKD